MAYSDRFAYSNPYYPIFRSGTEAIEVKKGSPDKANFAIFYSDGDDPVIFCKTQKEVDQEIQKLATSNEAELDSIYVYELTGKAKVEVNVEIEKVTKKGKK